MKTRRLLVGMISVSLALSAQAGMIEGDRAENAKPVKSRIEVIKTEAKKIVHRWTSYFERKIVELRNFSQPDRQSASEGRPTAGPTEVAAPVQVNEEQKTFSEIISSAQQKIRAKEAIREARPGRKGTSDLPKSRLGVPLFSLTKKEERVGKDGKKKIVRIPVKQIPRLDIGEERSISKSDFTLDDKIVGLRLPTAPKALASPAVTSQKKVDAVAKAKLPVVAKAKPPKADGIEIGQIVTMKKIQAVPLAMVPTKPLEDLKPVTEVTADDEKMLAAVILFEKRNKCHLVVGLLDGLANKPKYQEEANFYLGVCAHKMGFHSEAVSRLSAVLKSNHREFTSEALTNLVEDLPSEYDSQVASVLQSIKDIDSASDTTKDNVNFVLARAAHEKAQYDSMVRYSQRVSEKSPHYPKARFIYAIGKYGQQNKKDAEASLVSLREWMNKKGVNDKNLEALVTVNLARIAFTQRRYQAAHQEYQKVPKNHPLWVQALIEQGWAQLNIDDPEGAIGNMYSLHSPYFKLVYMPESWVVRTIGYINICQYGDAYKTLTRHEQLHSHWLNLMNKYMAAKKSPLDYYKTVRQYIRGQSDLSVDNLPPQVIREIARQKGFLNAQNALNNMEDEISQYGFIMGIIGKDQAEIAGKLKLTRDRLNKVKADIAKTKTHPELIKFLNEWNAQRRLDEQLVRYYSDMKELYKESRKGYASMRSKAVARIGKHKDRLRVQAGRELMAHMRDARSNIAQMLEGNEFLRYEIFAGSGENIRYQVAGGATEDTKRIPSNIKPQKIMNWEFDGEFWEDEIGSYRSSLKNNCPKNPKVRSAQIGNDDKGSI